MLIEKILRAPRKTYNFLVRLRFVNPHPDPVGGRDCGLHNIVYLKLFCFSWSQNKVFRESLNTFYFPEEYLLNSSLLLLYFEGHFSSISVASNTLSFILPVTTT